RLAQPAEMRKAQCPRDIAQQHVRSLDLRRSRAKCFGDRLFHQALAQADAQVAADDLDDVLGLESRGPPQEIAKPLGLLRRAGRACYLVESCSHVADR